MKKIKIQNTDLEVSRIALGCMRLMNMVVDETGFHQYPKSVEEVEVIIQAALDCGINFFDHADIYGGGQCETLFGQALAKHPEWREQMIIQDKCGICSGYYDSSKEHILESVNASLEKLQCGYLDLLLIHRPDALMDPREIAEAFDELHESGKVKYFGVSNMNPMQIELIQKYCNQKLVVDQVQFSVVHAPMIDEGIHVNMHDNEALSKDGHLMNYAMLHDITLQAWSIMQIDLFQGTYLDNPKYEKLNEKLDELATKYGVSKAAIAVAWILRHPANIQAIAGTANPEHLKDLAKADEIELTRPEWYELYLSVDRILP